MKYWEILLKKHREKGKDGLTIPFLIGSQQYLDTAAPQDIAGLIQDMAKSELMEYCIRYCFGTKTFIVEIRKPQNAAYNVIDSTGHETKISVGITSKDDFGESLESVINTLVDKFQHPIDFGLFSAEPNVDQREANWQNFSEDDILFIKNSFKEL